MREESSIERSIKAHYKEVVALYKNGTFYKEYSSIKEAVKDTNLSKTSISNALTGRSKSSGGFLWVYKEKYDQNYNYSYNPKTRGITVYQFNLDGILINQYSSKSYFEHLDGWSINGITSAIKEKKVYHDYYWSESP